MTWDISIHGSSQVTRTSKAETLKLFASRRSQAFGNSNSEDPNYRSKWSTSGGATLALTGVSHQGPYRPPIRGTSQRRGTPRTGQNSRQARTRSWAGPQSDWHRIQPLAPQGRSPRSSTFLPMQFKVNKFPKRILSQQQQKQRRTKKNNRPSRRLRKPKSVQVAYFVQQADSQWFRSLPPKIQQRDFSREEQKLLLTGCCDNNILDAADKAALYNKSAQTEFSSPFFFPSRSPEYCCSETSSMAASDVMSDSNVTLGDSTIYDSLRWLDEDRDLDLTLDDYHAHVMKSAAPPSKSRRRRPSFARRLSLSSPTFSRTSSMSISNRNNLQNVRNVDGTPKSNIVSSVAPQIGKFTNGSIDPVKPNPPSSTRPMSSYHAPRHVSHGSTSSIDPSAQYYHDPEARLKLRVYLASPQKFDEAVEFGFPSLENKENVRPAPGRSITEPQRPTHDTGRSVPQNDVSSGSNRDQHEKNKRQTQALAPLSTNDVARPLRSKSFSQKMSLDKRSRPFSLMPKGNSNGSGINREMTLKMTLTRPDLRTAGSTGTASPTPKDSDDPLKLAELPPVDENSPAWKTSEEGNGVMKKMWRRIKKYRS
ncbi:hypothetical protein FQN54_003127 [Arachnomyces sp. PD_36]|nr:hypothetical protein FQN54_003127 [Arachnomyces sp. PD_36]